MRELFIYYRIAPGSATNALRVVQAMQQRLQERHPGLQARLLRRPDETHDQSSAQQTWMEIYSFRDAGGVSPALQTDIEAEAAVLAPLILGTRHTEVFIPCVS